MNKSSTTVKIASNTIYQIIGKVISMSITVLATVVIARVYGRESYGQFSLMQGWPALFFIIVDFGINAIATRELSQDFSKANKYLGNILLIRILLSTFFIIALFIALIFFPYSAILKTGIRLGLLLILTQALFTTTNIVFQVKLRYDLSTIGYVAGYIFILLSILLLSYLKIHVMWINFSYVLGGLITFGLNFYFIKKLGVTPDLRFDPEVWKYLLINSLPLGLMFVFSQINFKADVIMMSALPLPKEYGLNNTETVAIYSLPYKVFEVALVVPTFFMNSIYPVLIRHMIQGKEKLKDTFFKSVGFLLLFGVFAGVFGILFSKTAINWLGGSEFSQSVQVLQILLGGLVLYYVSQPLAWLIVTLNGQKYLPVVYLISAVFNLSANYIFIQKYSYYAAAAITHLSELLILAFLIYFAHKSWKNKYA